MPRKIAGTTVKTPKIGLSATPGEIAQALAKGSAAIDSGQLLNALIECWGGPSRFARDIFSEYQQAKVGSLNRQRILEMLTRLTVQVTAQEIAKPKSATEMSTEELVDEFQKMVKVINARAARPAQEAP
jgi:hypothetical protein